MQKVYYQLYDLNKTNNPALALHYYELSSAIQDSIYSLENQKVINDFQVKYKTKEKELEIINQQRIIRYNNYFTLAIIIILVLMIIATILLIRNQKMIRRRNQDLIRYNQLKDRFLSIISHDLKNPAIGQQLVLHQLRTSYKHLSLNDIEQILNTLTTASDAQVYLLQNVLEWARFQTNKITFTPSNFDLTECIEGIIKIFSSNLSSKEIVITKNLPQQLFINSDKMILSTVIRNLLNNAIKFSPIKSSIEIGIIDTSEIDSIQLNNSDNAIADETWAELKKTNSLFLYFKDHGLGIDPELMRDLFIDKNLKSSHGTMGETGSGLGLILCKKLISICNENITAKSKKGIGSIS